MGRFVPISAFVAQVLLGAGGDRYHAAHGTLGYTLLIMSFSWQIPAGTTAYFTIYVWATLLVFRNIGYTQFATISLPYRYMKRTRS